MIRQSPTNPCLFETSVNGTDWCVWADISKCGNFGSQPGGGSSQPSAGGGIVSNCVTLQTSGQLLLQAPVTTGDTIEITSADGAGNDGTLPIWWCPDGSEYFAGLCTPLSSMVSTDPLPATQHMTLIVIIGGVPYPLYPGGVFTVPGGISLAQAVIQVNNAPLSDGSGSYNICYKQTNNQAASWCHTFDFRISKYGTIDAGSAGGAATWIPGIGWQHPGGGGNNNFISLTPGGSFTVTRIAAVFNTNGGVACGSCECEIFAPYPTVYPGADIIPISAGDNHLDASNTLTISSISLDANDGTATLLTWSSLTVYGKGFDPFTAVPVC